MCGIVGFTGPGAEREALVRRMAATLVHRGPDGDGYYVSDGIALGMRRLAVLDLAGGNQPMCSEDGNIVTVCNGEIYNYPELKQNLLARGHAYRTRCDTEALVHLYEDRREALLTELCGMFALAIWDRREQRLFLARDPVGIKPLYYAVRDGQLWFASEIKALLAAWRERPSLNPAVLDEFFHAQCVIGEATAFLGIQRLRPGHCLTWQAGKLTVRQYWDLTFEPKPGHDLEGLEAALAAAVRRHLLADVPVGVFLSGGLDSSGVAALMHRAGVAPLKTFSVGFAGDDEADAELPFARRMAAHLRTEHHEIIVTPDDVIASLPHLVWMLDEPNGDYAVIPTYLMARRARPLITVALTGEGGDELFGGYRVYTQPLAPGAVYRGFTGVCSEFDKRSCLTGDFHALLTHSPRHELENYFRSAPAADDLSRMLYTDFKGWLPDDLLMKVDRATMAVSLEARVPYLDTKLVEYVAGMPAASKVSGPETKVALKQVLRAFLPPEIINRPKQGFTVPLARWLKDRRFRDWMQGILFDPVTRQRGYYQVAAIADRFRGPELTQGEATTVWLLLVFELWCRQFLDGGTGRG